MKRAAVLVTALATAFSLAVPVGAGPVGGVFQATGGRVPYVVILADDPVVAYEGDVPGLAATKPGRGEKVRPNSPAVLRYLEHLDQRRADASARTDPPPPLLAWPQGQARRSDLRDASPANRRHHQKTPHS